MASVTRVSNEKDDPGYRDYCIIVGDKKKVLVYIDGVEQKLCTIADSAEGWVKRAVTTPDGNIAHDGDTILQEVVHGKVVIEVVPA